ncbi:MAG: TonB-dependent receptor domain-containing protein, partial [Panacagrimonas sp.]
RYQEEDRFLSKQFVQAKVLGLEPVTIFQFRKPEVDQHNFAHRVSLDFTPFDDALIYLSWARSYKSGSYNIVTLYAPPDYVEAEEATTVELGVKTSFVPGLTLNAAIFETDIENLQETVLALQDGGAISAENAGSARSRGVEFDALWVPFLDWNPGFVVSAGATYLDAIYTDYKDATGFNENTGLLFRNGDFSGNNIARTPDFSGTLSLSQTINTRYGPVEIGGEYYYNNGFNFSPQAATSTEQEAYALINARLSYLYQPWNLRITAFGRNIADERYAATSLVIDFGTFQTLAPPRTYGLALGYEF